MNKVRDALEDRKTVSRPQPASIPAAGQTVDLASRLEHPASVWDRGVLTPEEFNQQQMKLPG